MAPRPTLDGGDDDALDYRNTRLLHIDLRAVAEEKDRENRHRAGFPKVAGEGAASSERNQAGQEGIERRAQKQGDDHESTGNFLDRLQNFHLVSSISFVHISLVRTTVRLVKQKPCHIS